MLPKYCVIMMAFFLQHAAEVQAGDRKRRELALQGNTVLGLAATHRGGARSYSVLRRKRMFIRYHTSR